MMNILVTIPEGLGDCLQTLPVLQNLKSAGISLTILTNKAFEDLLRENFFFDNLYCQWQEFFLGKLKSMRFHAVLDLRGLDIEENFSKYVKYDFFISHTLFKDPMIKKGARCITINGEYIESIFFNAEGVVPKQAWTFYMDMYFALKMVSNIHLDAIKCFAEVIKDIKNLQHSFSFTQRVKSIAFLPAGTLKCKLWPLSRYLDLAYFFSQKGYDCVFYLGPSEQYIISKLRDLKFSLSLKINLPLVKLARELRSHSLVIANDCGPMHLSAVQGCPLIAVFKNTLPDCWFPYTAADQIHLGGCSFSGNFDSRVHNSSILVSYSEVLNAAKLILKDTD